MFDGISTGNARIVIEQEMCQETEEPLNLEQVENKGCYYLATIVCPDGS